MRTIYLSLGLLLATGAVAQQRTAPPTLSRLQLADPIEQSAPSASQGAGDTIAKSDFSNGSDWAITQEAGSPSGADWQLGFIDAFQRNYAREITSPTKDNGYAWCSGISIIFNQPTYGNIKTYLTSVNSYDLSAVSNATITFYQNYRPFNSDDCFVEFSTDGGTNWISNQVNTDGKDKMEWFSLVLPASVCNKPNVKVRFVWTAGNNGQYGAGYGWQIDDMSLVVTPNRELGVTDILFDGGNNATTFFHKELPLSQAHMYEPIITVKNNGALNQNVTVTAVVTKDGAAYGTYSNPTPVKVSTRKDTAFHFNTFEPTETGHYEVTYTVSGDSPGDIEATPADNVKKADFYITDGLYSDNDGTTWPTGSMWTAFHESGVSTNPYAELGVVQGFQVWNSGDKAYSVTTVFPSNSGTPFGVGQTLYFDLYQFADPSTYGSGYNNQKLINVASKEIDVAAADTTPAGQPAKYIQINFEEKPDLEEGLYIAMITSFGGNQAYNMPTYSGSNKDSSGGIRGIIQGGSNNSDYILYSNINPFIRLNAKDGQINVGINKNPSANFKVTQNVPNPFNAESLISYTLNTQASVEFTVTDISGKVVMNVPAQRMAAGKHSITLNASDFNAGVYFYTVAVDGEKITKKLIINQ